MVRKRLVVEVETPVVDQPYNVRLEVNTAQQIKSSREVSKVGWTRWVSAAIDRLQEEAPDEIESLLAQAQLMAGSRKDKVNLPFRVNTSDIDTVRTLAAKYDSSLQAVLIAAMHLYSFVARAVLFDVGDAEAGE